MLAETIVLLTMGASISIVGYWLVDELYSYQVTLSGITYNEGYKQLGIGAAIGIASWAVGLAIGGLAEEMLGWFGGYFYQNNLINTLRYDYYQHYNLLIYRDLRNADSSDAYVYTAAARAADIKYLDDLLVRIAIAQELYGSNSWNSVCQAKDRFGLCTSFYAPEESWDTDVSYHFATFASTLFLISFFGMGGYYLAYEWIAYEKGLKPSA